MIDGIKTRAAELVEAAYAVVAEVGFEGLRLRRVAADVGIDQSTLHHYFATKGDLVHAVAEYATTRLAASAPPPGTPREHAVAAHLRALVDLMRTDPDLLTVSAELDLHARRDPAVRATLDRQEAGWRAMLVSLLADPAAAELVIAAVKGVRLSPELAPSVFERLLGGLS